MTEPARSSWLSARRPVVGRIRGPWLAAAPISWGVSAIPGWGIQLTAQRVVAEARRLGLDGIEAGPPGFVRRAPMGLPRLRVAAGELTAAIDRSALPAVDSAARRLRRLGARMLLLSPEPDRAAMPAGRRPEAWARFFDALGAMDAICRRQNIELVLHPHPAGALSGQTDLERFLVGSEVGLCLDTGDLALAGVDPVDIVELAPRRIRHVHLKDLDPDLAGEVRSGELGHDEAVARGLSVPLARGSGHALNALDDLLSHGYSGWLVLELDRRLADARDPGGGPLAELRASLEAVLETALPDLR